MTMHLKKCVALSHMMHIKNRLLKNEQFSTIGELYTTPTTLVLIFTFI